jgi:glycolate oxidase
MFGHAGDGNVHIDVLKGDLPLEDWSAMLPEVKRTVYQQAIDLGGTITGEHGVGHLRRKYLPLLLDGNHIALMQRIKRAFDPELILNPGKIFP